MNLSSTLISRLTALKSLLDLGDVELVSVASSRLVEHQHEPAIQEIHTALADHRYVEAVRMIEKLLSDAYPKFIGMRAGEEKDLVIAAGVKMTFCWCPPGEFMMGSPQTEEGRYDDEKQTQIILTKGFWMAKTQVSQKQWVAIMGDNPSHFKGDYLPVESVSWDDAQEFIKKVNDRSLLPKGWKMALPTEAQWEYACRAGETGPFSGGTIDQVAWYIENSAYKTHQVGTKKSNAWGLHDMHGNVWECCADCYDDTLPGGDDTMETSLCGYRVNRGGSWGHEASCCRAAVRCWDDPGLPFYEMGFRPALVPFP